MSDTARGVEPSRRDFLAIAAVTGAAIATSDSEASVEAQAGGSAAPRAIYHELYQVGGVSGKYRALVLGDEPEVALPAEIGAIHTFRSPEDEDDLVAWVRSGGEQRPAEADRLPARSLPKRRPPQTWSAWLMAGGTAVAALVLVAYFTGAAGRRAGSVREDPEFQRMAKMVEELHKQIPQPQPGRVEEEAKSRAESPERYRENTYYWPVGLMIRVGFLGGDSAIQDKVFAIAREWAKYATVLFARAEAKNAEVRVSFDPTGEWSYLGTQSLSIPAGSRPRTSESPWISTTIWRAGITRCTRLVTCLA